MICDNNILLRSLAAGKLGPCKCGRATDTKKKKKKKKKKKIRIAEAGSDRSIRGAGAPRPARSARCPTRCLPAPHLVAERDGRIDAVLSLRSDELVADPFRYTAQVCDLLRRHLEKTIAATPPACAPERACIACRPALESA